MIKLQNLQYKLDQRGYGLYNLYENELPGQVNVTTTKPGIVRAFHYHKNQTDHWICIKGNIHVVLIRANIHESNELIGVDVDERGVPWFKLRGKNFGTEASTNGWIEHYYIGEKNPQMLTIPPGVLHGFSPMYGEEATLMYYTDKKYDPSDEYRVDWDFLGEDLWKVKNQ